MRKTILLVWLCLFLGFQLHAQERTVTGKVTDQSSGEGIPGVNIQVQGSSTGTVTDINGTYSIPVQEEAVLVYSFIGYQVQKIPVNNQSNINVALQENMMSLESVVVTGYQTERKKDITGAVSVADVDAMKKQAVANPMKALQGRVAGMNITGNGSPSAPATIRIRGVGTLNNNDPLFIIDGVPTKAGMHELNPANIESIQVLKDASAASIYGSRAANGVIIITTKKGKKGQMQVNANVYTSVSGYTTRRKMLDTEGYGKALWQAHINNGTDPNSNSVKYLYDWEVDPENGPVLNQVLVPEYLDGNKTMKSSNTDWFDEISQTGVIQNYDFSVSNGTENGNYLLSVGYFDNKGVIKTTDFNRLTVRLNSDYKLWDGRVTLGQNLSLSKTNEVSGSPMNAAMQALPIIPVRTEDGGWGGPVGGMNDRQNPVRLLMDNKQNDYDYQRLFGNFYADIQLLEGLTFRSNYGIDYGNYTSRQYRKRYTSGYLNNPVNRLQSNQTHHVKTTWTNTLKYHWVSGEHRLDILAGTELYQDKSHTFWASREDFVVEDDDFMYLDAGTGIKDNGGSGAKHVLLSYFGRANYSLMDKYLLSATLRYDGSSRFGQNNRFGTFPAFSAGWRLSEEGFIKNNTSIFDDLKLRFGWGMTGNQEIDNNAIYNLYVTDYASTSYDLNANKSGVLPSGYKLIQNANPNLRWEASTMTNLGLDFEIFNQRLYGSAEAYIRKTTDILLLPPYIATLGEGGNQWVNGASMENKGLEFTLGSRNRIGQDMLLELNANFDMYRNKITHLPDEVVNAYGGDGRGQNILGRPINSFFGYVENGLFRTDDEVEAHADQPGKGLGRIRYKDLNEDGVINDYDRTWIGTPHPKFSLGFNTSLEYKNFDFSFFLQGVFGIDVVNDFKYSTDFWSVSETGSNKGARLLDAWSPSNPGSDIPAISLVDNNWEARFSTYFIENGSYVKLRNLQLGYTLDEGLTSKIGMQSLRIYVGGDHLGILFKDKSFTGIDPENPGFGYPNPTVGTAGINVRF
ncbi:TonB-dependent receptor [Echinicola jeungdonensis]|uniref:SusC/RagA family TonB-linked outer membrane protein n=1 Tax=Echinicola jeungdonensis TaxID=709343 RepID=A0ABV5J743_9BACT|nr:TonB-dependent receptor [Echinicola jeungdonensis]MDN3669192.1 TonB-dependent receptor [Echinicola jeungdonensis]